MFPASVLVLTFEKSSRRMRSASRESDMTHCPLTIL
jgi:hypothetical protein